MQLSNLKLVSHLIHNQKPPLKPQELYLAMLLALKYRNEHTLLCKPTQRALATDLGLKHHHLAGRIVQALRDKNVLVTIKSVNPQDPFTPKKPLQYFFVFDFEQAQTIVENSNGAISNQLKEDYNCAREKLLPRNTL